VFSRWTSDTLGSSCTEAVREACLLAAFGCRSLTSISFFSIRGRRDFSWFELREGTDFISSGERRSEEEAGDKLRWGEPGKR